MNKPIKVRIPVFTVLKDNQDGGYTMKAYNTQEDWVKEEIAELNAWGLDDDQEPFTPESFLKEADQDEYQYGYQGSDSIEIVQVDGKWQLAEPLSFHAGQ